MIASFSVDSSSTIPFDRRPSLSVLSQAAHSTSSAAQPAPPALVPSTGCGWYNLSQDSRGLYSLSLFLLCLGLLCFFFLLAEYGGTDDSCRQLRVVDYSQVCSNPSNQSPQGYNRYDSHAGDNSLLMLSLLLALGGNTVYHRWSVALLLVSAAIQAYVFSQYAVDAPYCAWDQLGTVVNTCVAVGSSFSPACQDAADLQCENAMFSGAEFQLVSFRNLVVFLLLCLLQVMQLLAILKAAAMNLRVRALMTGRLSLSALVRLPSLLAPVRRYAAQEWCEQQLFGRCFATEQQRLWLTDISQSEHRDVLSKMRWSWSLRVTFAATFSLVLTSGLALATVLVTAAFMQHPLYSLISQLYELLACVLAGSVVACCFVWTMMLVHRLALSVAVKHRILSYLQAEWAMQSIQPVLESSKIRWFSLPFYTGSLFSSMLWSYIFVNFSVAIFLFVLVNQWTREFVLDHFNYIYTVIIIPAAFILVYRICAFRCVFGKWSWNHRVSLLEPPPRPRCYICCDSYGMCLGAWGGIMTIMLRMLGAFPTAVSRLDIATSGFDFVHDQFLSLVEVEAYRLYRDWKLQQAGVNVDLKECEQDEQLAGVIPV